MSFAATTVVTTATRKGRGAQWDGQSAEVFVFTKLTGDTTGTVTSTATAPITACDVYASDGSVIAAGQTITNTPGTNTVALTALGAGLSGVIVIRGARK